MYAGAVCPYASGLRGARCVACVRMAVQRHAPTVVQECVRLVAGVAGVLHHARQCVATCVMVGERTTAWPRMLVNA